ncbi:MAG: DUF4494 domain-containing protein [Tannerella sp.]|jgi:hypothetical protein|nr:DUF4494 domain-containing protein [Tannerella sp.]
MNNWFECKVSYDKTEDGGMPKKVTEPYLMDALSFTEAEARIIEELRPFVSGEFTVVDIKRVRLTELFFNPNGDRYYKVKVSMDSLDENTEKKTTVQMMAQASTLREAIDVVDAGMKGSLAGYEITSVVETALVDVFPFSPETKVTRAVTPESTAQE